MPEVIESKIDVLHLKARFQNSGNQTWNLFSTYFLLQRQFYPLLLHRLKPSTPRTM